MFKLMLLAGAGGFIGTCCRFLTNRLFLSYFKTTLPLATFTVNILGCLVLGILIGIMNKAGLISPKMNALLIIGFCGGFTTFSTFSYETLNLSINGETLISLLYIVASIVIGLVAVKLGLTIAN